MATTGTGSILVVGATGQQGGAVITALMQAAAVAGKPNQPFPHVLALTRNPSSTKAKALTAAHPSTSLTVVEGDISSPSAIFSAHAKGSIASVFVVTVPPHGSSAPGEDAVAIPFIDAAVAHGVSHVVFSSVDRGGEPRSWENPTDIRHFYEKHRVEVHLREVLAAAEKEKGKDANVTYTVLRPVAFMENMNAGGMFCPMFISMWGQALKPTTKLQLVSVRDIGRTAARALVEPGKDVSKYKNRAVGLAGDELTLAEVKETFRKVNGREIPEAWGIVGKGMLWAIGEVGRMFAFFEREGYGVDVEALKREDPEVLGFEEWLRTESRWRGEK